jgi:hypothetical protein
MVLFIVLSILNLDSKRKTNLKIIKGFMQIMLRSMLFMSLLIFSTLYGSGEVQYGRYFDDTAIRVDLILHGNQSETAVSIKTIRREPHWSGPRNNTIDPFKFGEFKFHIVNKKSGELIYSRGFCTFFEEWQTTAEARSVSRSFDQVIVFPEPRESFFLEVFRRDEQNHFKSLFTHEIDPSGKKILEGMNPEYPVRKILHNGNSVECLDIVFIAEGYTATNQEKFFTDASRFTSAILAAEPFGSMSSNLNVWAIASESVESGVDLPGDSIWKNTVLNSSFWTFGTERYLMTEDIISVRDVAGIVPYDVICILANTDKYGGGGIYNHYAITSSDGAFSESTLVHELGHLLAGLGDEYYSSSVAYEGFYDLNIEPWPVNLTTLVNFESKWKNLVNDTIPIPTPETQIYQSITGVFEGGGYSARGIYRPSMDCRMNSTRASEFCEVCRKAIEEMIYYYCGH